MTRRNDIELQSYAAIIACMLITLWTGRKPTLRTYEMLCWYFTGMADEEELLAHNHNMPSPPPATTDRLQKNVKIFLADKTADAHNAGFNGFSSKHRGA